MSDSPQIAPVWGWRGAASGVVDCLKQALDTGERSDIEFAVGRQHEEEQLFRAHKLILSLRSDVFNTMFYGEVPETRERIELPDIPPQAFAVMLKFLYTDLVEDLNLENAIPTMYCATKYGIPKLFDICAQYAVINVDKDTCLIVLEAAMLLEAGNLVSKCMEIVAAHCTELLQSPAFLQLESKTVREIFSRDTLIVSEGEVYNAAQRWAANACVTCGLEPTTANYRFVLGEALFAVRFPLLDDGHLANGPVEAGLLLDEELHMIQVFKHAAEKPDIPFSSMPRSSDIVFSDCRWTVKNRSKIPEDSGRDILMVATGNAFVDKQGHLHLRVSQRNGVWEGAGVRLVGALGFGRYEFHIEGLDRMEHPSASLVLESRAGNGQSAGIYVFPEVDGTMCSVGYLVGRAPPSDEVDSLACSIEGESHTTHSFHRKPDSVSFRCQRGHQQNNTAEEMCSWSSTAAPNIPHITFQLVIFLMPDSPGAESSDRKAAEIVVHSFRFYPDE